MRSSKPLTTSSQNSMEAQRQKAIKQVLVAKQRGPGSLTPVKMDIDRRERAKANFPYFVKQAWKVIEPATPLLWNWHIDTICEHLMAVYEGDITRLLVNIAPGTMKSILFSVMWPAWCWLTAPHIRW